MYTSVQEPKGLHTPWSSNSTPTSPSTSHQKTKKLVLSDTEDEDEEEVLEIVTDKVLANNDNEYDPIHYYNVLFRKCVMSLNFD